MSRNLESDGLEREMGYLPRNEKEPYIMDERDALGSMIAGIMGHEGEGEWASISERLVLNKIMEDNVSQDFNALKKRIDE